MRFDWSIVFAPRPIRGAETTEATTYLTIVAPEEFFAYRTLDDIVPAVFPVR
jgi:hypothetical protein